MFIAPYRIAPLMLFGVLAITSALQAAEPATPRDAARRQLEGAASGAVSPIRKPFTKANETCQPNLILCGQTMQGSLASTDCGSDGSFVDGWFFPNYSRQAVGVAMSSPDFDVLTGLATTSGQILGAAEAPAGGIASFGAFLTTFGNFEIIAGSQPSSAVKTGPYLLTLVCGGESRCAPDVATMCLGQSRFRVQVAWHNQFNDTYGFGRAVPRTDSGGFFSFGDPDNIELLIKVLDFGGGQFKVFYGELTNLEFSVAITDMSQDLPFTKTYTNTAGDCGGIDQDFLGSANPQSKAAATAAGAVVAKAGSCRADKNTICLLDKRFAMTMTWHNQFNDTSGAGGAVPLSDLTGAFYFSDKTDLELVAKVIDFGDRIAVFYGALSDLQYDLTVTDTASGVQKVYHNAPGNYCGGLDNTAFP